ncbi:MAG TPA: hypothetical protein VJQ45_11755, partial [Ktedonobacterales bacterium]|nr:hypothetical protein [Ktedonobacterales bacterium]
MADFTVAAEVKPPTFDPLKTAGAAMALQSGMLNNRLLGLQVRGKQALGSIIGQNTDPNTGEVDWQKVSSDASADPAAAILMPEIQGQVLDRQIKQQQLAGVTLDMQMKRARGIADTTGALLSTPEGQLTPDMVMDAATTRLVKTGILNDPQSLTQLASLGQQLQGKSDPQIRTILQQLGQSADASSSRLEYQFAQQNNGLSPTTAAGQVSVPVFDKATKRWVPTQRPLGEVVQLEKTSGPIQTGPGTTAEGVPISEAGKPAYSVQTPNGTPGMVTEGEAARSAAAGAAPQVITTGAAPGVIQANTAPVVARGQRAAQLEESFLGAAGQQRRATLQEMTSSLGGFRSGPGAAWASRHIAEVNRTLGTNFAQNEVGAQQAFGKQAEQVAAQQGAALHLDTTNLQHEAAKLASPNVPYSDEANRRVIAQLRGNEDFGNAMAKAWALAQKPKAQGGGGLDPSQFNVFEQQFTSLFDPRYFQERYMTAGQRGEMAREMGPDGWKQFKAARDKALA